MHRKASSEPCIKRTRSVENVGVGTRARAAAVDKDKRNEDGSKGINTHGHLRGPPVLGKELVVPLWEKVDTAQWSGREGNRTIPRKKEREKERRDKKKHNEERRMQFPVSLSLSVVLNACLHTQSGKQTMGHFTAPDGRSSQSTCSFFFNPNSRGTIILD